MSGTAPRSNASTAGCSTPSTRSPRPLPAPSGSPTRWRCPVRRPPSPKGVAATTGSSSPSGRRSFPRAVRSRAGFSPATSSCSARPARARRRRRFSPSSRPWPARRPIGSAPPSSSTPSASSPRCSSGSRPSGCATCAPTPWCSTSMAGPRLRLDADLAAGRRVSAAHRILLRVVSFVPSSSAHTLLWAPAARGLRRVLRQGGGGARALGACPGADAHRARRPRAGDLARGRPRRPRLGRGAPRPRRGLAGRDTLSDEGRDLLEHVRTYWASMSEITDQYAGVRA